MVRNILLIVGIVLLVFLYLRIAICYLKYKKVIIQDIDGFSVAKEITSDYDFIHIVEAKGQIFSCYDVKRNVIRLTSIDYYSSDLFHLGMAFLLAKYACYYQEEKSSNLFCKIFLKVYVLFFSAFIGSIISLFTHTIGDAKIGVFLLVILLFIDYFYFILNSWENTSGDNGLGDKNFTDVKIILSNVLFFSKLSFICNLIFLLREIVIIFNL